MDMMNERALEAAIYGVAVADALGVPYEFRHRGTFMCSAMAGGGVHAQPAGTFSDDTSMTLATLDSLNHCSGRVDAEDLLDRFRDWRWHGAYTADGTVFDVGNTTAMALDHGYGGNDERDNGNGALMRIIPLTFFDISDEQIREASAVTHAHAISMDACVTYVHLARRLAQGTPIREAVAEAGYDGLWNQAREAIHSSGFVLHTLEAACWCLSTTNSYGDCVLKAVNLGLDTDTTAAVAGGLAGIVYGFADQHHPSGIPLEWVDALRGKPVIDCILAGSPAACD